MSATPETQGRTPNPVDVHVGLRIRRRRRELGMGQEALAGKLGLTFQQVQKYERGANRVSASKLYETARALAVPAAWFFEGLADPTQGGDQPANHGADPALVMTTQPYGLQAARDYVALGSNLDRSIVAALLRRLVEGAGDLPTVALSVGLSTLEMTTVPEALSAETRKAIERAVAQAGRTAVAAVQQLGRLDR